VVLSGRREKEGADVVAEIQQLGGAAAFIRGTSQKMPTLKQWSTSQSPLCRLDIAFNNAGVEWIGPLIRPPRPNTAASSTSTFGAF